MLALFGACRDASEREVKCFVYSQIRVSCRESLIHVKARVKAQTLYSSEKKGRL
jgi:hypothetical protein